MINLGFISSFDGYEIEFEFISKEYELHGVNFLEWSWYKEV